MKKLIKIVMLTAVLAVMLAVPCFAEEAAEGTMREGLTGAVDSFLNFCQGNPETVLAAIVTGAAGGVNLAGGISNRKTRRKVSLDVVSLQSKAAAINNNAVELAGTVKTEVVGLVKTVTVELGHAVQAICNKIDELIHTVGENIRETKAMRREIKALSFQINELVEDSRMTRLRKDEIKTGYEKILKGGEEVNDDGDQA